MEKFNNFDITVICIGVSLILAWMFGVAYWLQKLMKEYTMKDWGETPNPYETETLGLPRGTLRGILTLTLLIVVVIMICMSMLVKQLAGTFDAMVDAFQLMLAFYFGSKVMHHVTESDQKKSKSKNEADVEISKAQNAITEPCSQENEKSFEIDGAIG